MDEATARAFGRVEAKLDQVFALQSAQGSEIAALRAEHGVRLDHVESDVGELKTRNTADDRHGISVRGSIFVGLCTVLASGLVTTLVALFVK
ncbi:hypothetical protein [Lentzea sp. NBRC 102530]|uniref:hypothetical protein n=1 Tax=Lentzea sp. NBRC 102530 TaxID=3032201 RepID=UPI0024A07225|nr:hypothetical protein [Lentzea sp. NBRC 102530]GLY55177.1 hypothetical protein Lesp01_88320 [Lentzea sp. NBRC 102530]